MKTYESRTDAYKYISNTCFDSNLDTHVSHSKKRSYGQAPFDYVIPVRLLL